MLRGIGKPLLKRPIKSDFNGRVQGPDFSRNHRFNPGTSSLCERSRFLQLAARGDSNAAIGSELHLSQATVKYHLAQIYTKLGAPDRAAAVAMALDRGLIRLAR